MIMAIFAFRVCKKLVSLEINLSPLFSLFLGLDLLLRLSWLGDAVKVPLDRAVKFV